MLQIGKLSKRFDRTQVLHAIDLEIAQGELVALLGPSGSGKTTLLRIVAGFEDADTGNVHLRDQRLIGGGSALPAEKRKIGMVFQDYALFPHLSVRENVGFGLARSSDRSRRIEAVLETVGLRELIDAMPHELSGGQQQRIALARALAPHPEMLLLDEPFSNLDPALRVQVRQDVRQILRDANMTALLVTHDQEEALSIADRVAVMLRGEISQLGSPLDIYHRPVNREVAAFVGDAQFVAGRAEDGVFHTSFGAAPLANRAARGAFSALVRPEMIELGDADTAGFVPATVQKVSFHGRDHRLQLTLADGEALIARDQANRMWHIGESVGVRLRGPIHIVP